MNSTIRFFDPENIVLDTKIIILCACSKVITKNAFLQNDRKHNVPVNGSRTDR